MLKTSLHTQETQVLLNIKKVAMQNPDYDAE